MDDLIHAMHLIANCFWVETPSLKLCLSLSRHPNKATKPLMGKKKKGTVAVSLTTLPPHTGHRLNTRLFSHSCSRTKATVCLASVAGDVHTQSPLQNYKTPSGSF